MSHQEIVETRGKYRAVIGIDEYASEPDGDFFGTVYYGADRGTRFERQAAPYKSPDDFSDELTSAWEHYRDMALVERYLRIWHGIRGFDYFDTQAGKYVNIVTDYDLKLWGWDEDPEKWPAADPAEHNLDEWRAYSEGDVWIITVEKSVTWTTDDEDVDDSERDDWETLNDTTVGGYYGEQWAREAATDALDDHAPRPCRKCGEPLKRDETQQPPWPWVHVDGNTDHEPDGSVLR